MTAPPRNVEVLVNPSAAGGRGARAGVRTLRALRDLGVGTRALVGRDAAEATDLAHAAVSRGADALVVVGGDGLVHQALQAVAGTSTPLGVVPAGTGNDVARYLGLPRRSPEAGARVVAAGRTRRLDLGRADGRYFLTVLAGGFDARVNERANRMRWPGPLRYNVAVVAELGRFTPLAYSLELDGVHSGLDAMLVAVGNGPAYGGGLRICEGAQLDDGFLDVVIIKPLSRLGMVRMFRRLYDGSLVRMPVYEHHRVRRVSVAAADVVAHVDGERLGPLPVTVECVPGALTAIVGPEGPGA